jgi:hypothetical protein
MTQNPDEETAKKDQSSSRMNQNVKKEMIFTENPARESESPYLKVYVEVRIFSWNFPEKVMEN